MGKSSQRRLNKAISENLRARTLNTRLWRKVNYEVQLIKSGYDKNAKYKDSRPRVQSSRTA
jgi:hypothetical protein